MCACEKNRPWKITGPVNKFLNSSHALNGFWLTVLLKNHGSKSHIEQTFKVLICRTILSKISNILWFYTHKINKTKPFGYTVLHYILRSWIFYQSLHFFNCTSICPGIKIRIRGLLTCWILIQLKLIIFSNKGNF